MPQDEGSAGVSTEAVLTMGSMCPIPPLVLSLDTYPAVGIGPCAPVHRGALFGVGGTVAVSQNAAAFDLVLFVGGNVKSFCGSAKTRLLLPLLSAPNGAARGWAQRIVAGVRRLRTRPVGRNGKLGRILRLVVLDGLQSTTRGKRRPQSTILSPPDIIPVQ